jgi:conjugal transfer pilus assembly protein TraL
MQEIEIPRFVDSQYQVFWWEMDEAATVIALFGIGIASGALLLMMLLIPSTLYMLKKYKNSTLEGGMLHAVWSVGIVPLGKEFQDPFEKEFYL